MFCKIYDINHNELLTFETDNFSEKMDVRRNEVNTILSCSLLTKDDIFTDKIINEFEPIMNITLSLIEFYSNEKLIGEYTSYTKCSSVNAIYSQLTDKFEGVVNFSK